VLPERIADKIDASGPCWLWTASLTQGYGQAYLGGKHKAHRLVWELLVGPVPDGLELDHLCLVKHCVNPDHLEPVTHAENVRRGLARKGWPPYCPKGHPYDRANTMLRLSGPKVGTRLCRECQRASSERYRRRMRSTDRRQRRIAGL
jgi:hypothetical protein